LELDVFFKKGKTDLEYNSRLLTHLRAKVDAVLGGESEKVGATERKVLEIRGSQVWNLFSDGNAEVDYELGFGKLLAAISERTNERVDKMSTFQFYVMMDYLKESAEKQKR
jgi:hypothetical protein